MSRSDRFTPGSVPRSPWRRSLDLALIALTSLSLVTSVVAVWVHQVAFDTDRFMETLEPVLDDHGLYDLIGDEVTDSVLGALAIQDRLEEAFADLDSYLSSAVSDGDPETSGTRDNLLSFTRLAAPIADALEDRIDVRIHSFITPDRFAGALAGLARRAHEVAVAVVRGNITEYPNVYVDGDEIRVSLTGVIAAVLQPVAEDIRAVLPDFDPPERVSDRLEEGRDQLATALQVNLPDDFGQVTVMSSERLPAAQGLAALFDRYVWISVALTAALIALTFFMAADRRRALVQLGVGVLVAVLAAALAIRQLESAIVAEIVDPGGSAFASLLLSDLLSGLRTVQFITAFAAVLLTSLALVAGRPGRLSAAGQVVVRWTDRSSGVSRLDRWVFRYAGLLRVLGVVVPAILLFLVGVDWVSIVVIGVLLSAYLWAIGAAGKRVARSIPGVVAKDTDT